MEAEITGQLLEATKHQVEMEMRQYADQSLKSFDEQKFPREFYPNGRPNLDTLMWVDYYNNFYGHLPGGFYRQMFASQFDRKTASNPQGSDIKQNQTLGEFFEAVDKAILAEKLDLGEVERKVNGLRDDTNHADLFKFVFPVYVRLRAMGYNRKDLNT